MGKIKEQAKKTPEADSFYLTQQEFDRLNRSNQLKNAIIMALNKTISEDLHDIAVDRLSYGKDDMLQFEVDFDNDKRELKVTKLQDNLYSPTEQELPKEAEKSPELN